MNEATGVERDAIDDWVEFWAQRNSAVDPLVKGIAVRLRRVAAHLERVTRRELAGLGMERWEFEVLPPLRKAAGERASVGQLARESQLSAAAMTNRVTQLESRGLVRRDTDTDDRRQVIVSLTDAGRARADEMIALKLRAEQQTFGSLDRSTQERLHADLRTLLGHLEGHLSLEMPDE